MSEKIKSIRTRNFATVVYPESAPSNWVDLLTEFHIPAFISPLHDKDYNVTGEEKKAHYHVMIMYEGVKTREQASEVFLAIGGVGCEIVNTIRGYARYLCHLDNPDKAQYSVDDVIVLCGADYHGTIGLASNKYQAVREMIDYCVTNDIVCYADLLEYSAIHRFDWFTVLCDNGTVVMDKYLKSFAWRKSFLSDNT